MNSNQSHAPMETTSGMYFDPGMASNASLYLSASETGYTGKQVCVIVFAVAAAVVYLIILCRNLNGWVCFMCEDLRELDMTINAPLDDACKHCCSMTCKPCAIILLILASFWDCICIGCILTKAVHERRYRRSHDRYPQGESNARLRTNRLNVATYEAVFPNDLELRGVVGPIPTERGWQHVWPRWQQREQSWLSLQPHQQLPTEWDQDKNYEWINYIFSTERSVRARLEMLRCRFETSASFRKQFGYLIRDHPYVFNVQHDPTWAESSLYLGSATNPELHQMLKVDRLNIRAANHSTNPTFHEFLPPSGSIPVIIDQQPVTAAQRIVVEERPLLEAAVQDHLPRAEIHAPRTFLDAGTTMPPRTRRKKVPGVNRGVVTNSVKLSDTSCSPFFSRSHSASSQTFASSLAVADAENSPAPIAQYFASTQTFFAGPRQSDSSCSPLRISANTAASQTRFTGPKYSEASCSPISFPANTISSQTAAPKLAEASCSPHKYSNLTTFFPGVISFAQVDETKSANYWASPQTSPDTSPVAEVRVHNRFAAFARRSKRPAKDAASQAGGDLHLNDESRDSDEFQEKSKVHESLNINEEAKRNKVVEYKFRLMQVPNKSKRRSKSRRKDSNRSTVDDIHRETLDFHEKSVQQAKTALNATLDRLRHDHPENWDKATTPRTRSRSFGRKCAMAFCQKSTTLSFVFRWTIRVA